MSSYVCWRQDPRFNIFIADWQFITKLSNTKTSCGCIGANQLGASQIVLIDNLEAFWLLVWNLIIDRNKLTFNLAAGVKRFVYCNLKERLWLLLQTASTSEVTHFRDIINCVFRNEITLSSGVLVLVQTLSFENRWTKSHFRANFEITIKNRLPAVRLKHARLYPGYCELARNQEFPRGDTMSKKSYS